MKNKFVAVAVDARIKALNDSEGEFVRDANCVAQSAGGRVAIVTASGKLLGGGWGIQAYEKALKEFAELPELERLPGAVRIAERSPLDPKRLAQSPPPNCLIVRVFNRQLGRDAKGDLRYTNPEDYVPSAGLNEKAHAARCREPADDHMWIMEAEWKALMPANPRKGDQVRVPDTLRERLFRYHLDPSRGMGESIAFSGTRPQSSQFKLVVEEVSASSVRLRLEGFAVLKKEISNNYEGARNYTHYEPALLGYLSYDPARKVMTRFDVVALGDLDGRPLGENRIGERTGRQPLGIAFELVAKPQKAEDFLHPRGVRDHRDLYLLPK